MEKGIEETDMRVIRKSLREKDDNERQILMEFDILRKSFVEKEERDKQIRQIIFEFNTLRKSFLEKEERDKQIIFDLKDIKARLPKPKSVFSNSLQNSKARLPIEQEKTEETAMKAIRKSLRNRRTNPFCV